jgi:succinylarginine dihydrolase
MPSSPIMAQLNLDGLVGPTHHYGGLGLGNVASLQHRHQESNPRAAALEGLAKMRYLLDLGIPQGVLPPQERPMVGALRQVGFTGSDAAVLACASREAPQLLSAVASSSSMWGANAATFSPSADTPDGRVHLTPANLVSQFHRSLETPVTAAVLARIFADQTRFTHHPPLPACQAFADEGGANQMRLSPGGGTAGIELFVFGREGDRRPVGRHPARQSRAASEAIARLHGLAVDRTILLRQNEAAISAGVFHNDVIALGTGNLLIVHEEAYADGPQAISMIREAYAKACGSELVLVEVPAAEVSLALAVETYLFNSQLIRLPAGGMAMVCPAECREQTTTSRWLDSLVAGSNPIVAVHAVDVRQSMHNGGGPACLRLALDLTADELAAVHPSILLTPTRLDVLEGWVRRHYRDRLTLADLADPALLDESRQALDELSQLLDLPGLYTFQR